MNPAIATAGAPFLSNVVVFGRLLRRAGLPVSADQNLTFARALTWIDIGNRDQVFSAARSCYVTRSEDLTLFSLLFERYWHPQTSSSTAGRAQAPIAPRYDLKKQRQFSLVHYMAARAGSNDPKIDVADRTGTYSQEEIVHRKGFADMTPDELESVRELIEGLRWQAALRRTRRRVSDPRGRRIHLRRIIRDAARFDGTPIRLWYQSRKIKQRPIVLIADISGSMEKYSRLVLQFFYGLTHSLHRVESFVFGTRLSRITNELRLRNIDRALYQAGQEVFDWAGGTRIGDSLSAFNREWGRRVLRRGAIVVVVSDGWERGDVETLSREMRHLHHRCHRLIWLNPHLGHDSYQPLVEGMAAAIPYVDDFLPIHNFQSIEALARRLGALPRRRSGSVKSGDFASAGLPPGL